MERTDLEIYKELAAKYLKDLRYFQELHRTARIEADGYWDILQHAQDDIDRIIGQRDGLATAGENLMSEIDKPDYPTHTGMALIYKDEMQQALARAKGDAKKGVE